MSVPKYDVDIITPVYGSPHYLRPLAKSLLEDVDAGVPFHWILIDDATPPERGQAEVLAILRELREIEHVTVIENKVNGGFAKSNNLAATKGRAPLILMLNSDILAKEDGWLARMKQNFDDNPLVGVVGARLLFFEEEDAPWSTEADRRKRPPGTVQHAGVTFNLLGQPYHIFIAWSPDHPKVMEKRVMRAVTGACLMTRRKLWRKMGGLAEVYTVGTFEDVEYCVQLAARGNIVLYDPEVCLYHYSGGSDNTPTARRNHNIFQLRNRQFVVWDEWQYY